MPRDEKNRSYHYTRREALGLAGGSLVGLLGTVLTGCSAPQDASTPQADTQGAEQTTDATDVASAFVSEKVPLTRNGIALNLVRTQLQDVTPDKSILLNHGVTYSSHEFDIDYEDYSLVRFLAGLGYAVWRLDIAGFGESEKVADGFMPDTAYAAEDAAAAAQLIIETDGREAIDLLGWSWGTTVASRMAAAHPELIDRLVLYAPILRGLGAADVSEPFHHNDWDHAASDFQTLPDGTHDPKITDPVLIECYCSSCWHHDGEESPNGGRRDLMVDASTQIIDLPAIEAPTLVICGDADPYLDFDAVNGSLDLLPEGSVLEVIPGGSHIVMYEKPYYHDFQERLAAFLG